MKKLSLLAALALVACQSHPMIEKGTVVEFNNSTYYKFTDTKLNESRLDEVGSACEYFSPEVHATHGCSASPAITFVDIRDASDPSIKFGNRVCIWVDQPKDGMYCVQNKDGKELGLFMTNQTLSHFVFKDVCLTDFDEGCPK